MSSFSFSGQLSSAKPFLALLQETEPDLIDFALKNLDKHVNDFWYEMSRELPLLLEVSESENLTPETKQRACLVASQVYFHMGKISESVRYALGARELLDVGKRSEFTDTIVGACVDLYVSIREKQQAEEDSSSSSSSATAAAGGFDGDDNNSNSGGNALNLTSGAIMQRYASTAASSYESSPEVDARVAEVFERLATTWSDDNAIAAKEMVGFCLRARRCDLLSQLLKRTAANSSSATAASVSSTAASATSSNSSSFGLALVSHAFQVSMAHVRDMKFRREAIRTIADLYSEMLEVDSTTSEIFQYAQCLVFLEDAEGIASLCRKLLKDSNSKKSVAIGNALQLAFDISEASNQDFRQSIIKILESYITAEEGGGEGEKQQEKQLGSGEEQGNNNNNNNNKEGGEKEKSLNSRLNDLIGILSGSVSTDLYLKFLFSRCKADTPMFQKMKKIVPAKAGLLVSAVMTSGCLSFAGTAHDSFLRDNIAILARLSDWARYTAAASLGVVHRGHTSMIMNLLKPYLPNRGNVSPLPYQEAGSLFALGLAVCGNLKNDETVKYLKDALTDFSASEQLVHGASMGLGLAALGVHDHAIADQLFTCVTSCEATASEGSALAIGLVMLGSANEDLCSQLLNCAREQGQKEKTIRGLVMGIALMMLRRESLALPLINDMAQDRDPWIRVGAAYVLGLAYAATDSTVAIEKLLKLCVNDAHDEVRRAAIMMIGFVCLANVHHAVTMVRPFTDNYSPHVRYGVAMALAIASAGVADPSVLRLLKRLSDDAVNFVRQGAVLAQSLVLIQATEQQTSYVKEFRQKVWSLISDQKVDTCCKFGAIVAAGLLDAGGRNCTFALHRSGTALLRPVVGMFIFSQHWYWFPNVLPVCLALQPTCVIGLNDQMVMPQLALLSNAPPENFAPPPTMLEEKAKDSKSGEKKLATLSATTMEEQRKADKKKKTGGGAGGVSEDGASSSSRPSSATAAASGGAAGDAEGGGEKKEGEGEGGEKKKDEKKTSEEIQNPARVTKAQLSVIDVLPDQRYVPLRGKLTLGINMLRDTMPEKGVDDKVFNVDFSQRSDDVKPPEPFSWP